MSLSTLPLSFLEGRMRAAFATLPEALAAGREAADYDDLHRDRAVWFVHGASSCGVVVPPRFIVGIDRRGIEIDGHLAQHRVGPSTWTPGTGRKQDPPRSQPSKPRQPLRAASPRAAGAPAAGDLLPPAPGASRASDLRAPAGARSAGGEPADLGLEDQQCALPPQASGGRDFSRRRVEQSVAREAHNLEVAGSSPAPATRSSAQACSAKSGADGSNARIKAGVAAGETAPYFGSLQRSCVAALPQRLEAVGLGHLRPGSDGGGSALRESLSHSPHYERHLGSHVRPRTLNAAGMMTPKSHVRLPDEVRGDYPVGHETVAPAGIYVAHVNPQGAVSVQTPNGMLGVKPGEFEWCDAPAEAPRG